MSSNGEADWLNSLRGEFPLLERSEVEYIAEVQRTIIKEAVSKPGLNGGNNNLKVKLSIMKNNFAKIVDYLKGNSSSKEDFLNTYGDWRKVRYMTIKQLNGIAIKINENNQECSEARVAGSTLSIIGGLVALATGYGALRILGASFMGLGTLVSAGSSAREVDLLREKIKEAEKVIEVDREFSVKLWDWISDVSHIQEALDTIRNIRLDDKLKEVASDFHRQYKMKWCPGDVIALLKKMHFLKVFPQIVSEMIPVISEIVGISVATSMLFHRYRNLFNRAFETYKFNKILSTACTLAIGSFQVSSAVKFRNGLKLTTLQKSTIITGIVLDVFSIILASESAESTSKEAEEIVKAAKKLEEEADVFDKLYVAVKKS